jgi:aminoglycoside 6'-N-acetyltransferase
VTAPTLNGDELVLRPVERGDAERLRAIVRSPAVALRWGPQSDDFPFDDDSVTRLSIVADDEVIGMMQFYEEPDPDARSADIDIFLAPERAARGSRSGVAWLTPCESRCHPARYMQASPSELSSTGSRR